LEDTDEVLKRVGAKSSWEMTQHMKEFIGQAIQLGAVVDKNGHIMKTFVDRNIQIGDAFKKNGETTATWIHTMEIYLEKTHGAEDIVKRLTTAGFDEATAKKIAAAAWEDYNNKIKAGLPLIGDATKATQKLTDSVNGIQLATAAAAKVFAPGGLLLSGLAEFKARVGTAFSGPTGKSLLGPYIEDLKKGATGTKDFGTTTSTTFKNLINNVDPAEKGLNLIGDILDELPFKEDEWNKKIEESKKAIDHTTPTLDKMREAADKATQSFANFAKQSRDKLSLAFGIKSPDEQADKLIKDFVDKLDKKAKKVIKLDLNIEAKNTAFEKLAGTIITGLKGEIEKDDTLADAVAKRLIKETPDTEDGRRMKSWLQGAINSSDTGKLLSDNIQETFPGTFVLKVPATPDFTGSVFGNTRETAGIDQFGESAMKAPKGVKPVAWPAVPDFSIMRVGAGGDIGQLPFIDQSKIPKGDGTIGVDPNLGKKKTPTTTGGFGDFTSLTTNAKAAFAQIGKEFDKMLGKLTSGSAAWTHQWSSDMNSMAINMKSGGAKVGKEFDKMLGKITSGSAAWTHQWSSDMNSMVVNMKSAGSKVIKEFDKMISKISDGASAFAHQWSSDMNSMVANAKSAASGVNSALAKIKDVNVTVHVGASGPGLQFAQKGMHETLGKDTLIMAHKGERVDIGPGSGSHGSSGSGGGSSGGNILNATFIIQGNEIINTRKLRKMIRLESGGQMDRF